MKWSNQKETKALAFVCTGSLLVVLLRRTAQYNVSKLKDVYMHQKTLAVLANVALHMSGMSSNAVQRLVSLSDML
jgi:hypothetical protein